MKMELYLWIWIILLFVIILFCLDLAITYSSFSISDAAKKAEDISLVVLKETTTTTDEIARINNEVNLIFDGFNEAIEKFQNYVDQTICSHCRSLPVPPIGQWTIENGICEYFLNQLHICPST